MERSTTLWTFVPHSYVALRTRPSSSDNCAAFVSAELDDDVDTRLASDRSWDFLYILYAKTMDV